MNHMNHRAIRFDLPLRATYVFKDLERIPDHIVRGQSKAQLEYPANPPRRKPETPPAQNAAQTQTI
jgi:hypothetical protein